jgi:hypothetical protein
MLTAVLDCEFQALAESGIDLGGHAIDQEDVEDQDAEHVKGHANRRRDDRHPRGLDPI